ncbi:MAG: hypothetical protein AAGE52_37070 [Myxococcota bacterium]
MVPVHTWLLLFPRQIQRRLDEIRTSGLVAPDDVPNLWQIQLGVARMWHRVFFRPETIGQCADFAPRTTWRARLLEKRPLRFPFLLRARAVHPLDFSGLASSPERIVSHLLGAHHDGVQFHYDFELLSTHPEKLQEVRQRAKAVVDGSDPQAEWLRDLVVYEHYHENLLAAIEGFLAGELSVPATQKDDPDIVFVAYLRWCARQPSTPRETYQAWREGRYTVDEGIASRVTDAASAVAMNGVR